MYFANIAWLRANFFDVVWVDISSSETLKYHKGDFFYSSIYNVWNSKFMLVHCWTLKSPLKIIHLVFKQRGK